MQDNLGARALREVFSALGEHLAAAGERHALIVVGGASLIAGGWIDRATKDVDVIARATGDDRRLVPPDPLPVGLAEAIRRVARDYGLSESWLNTAVAAQWTAGVPPGLEEDIRWESFGGLTIGYAGRRSLIALKLFAAVDQGPDSVHTQDLVALRPTGEELGRAGEWVTTQDAAEEFGRLLEEVISHVRGELGRSGGSRA